jgi:anhydro-N-acetylmuramic acid kinase
MLAIGLMSGTSLDGIDAVLCDIVGCDADTQIKTLDFITLTMPSLTKQSILSLVKDDQAGIRKLTSLNVELGHLFADAVLELMKRNHLKASDVAFIASHGQTIYHLPNPNEGEYKSTLQIGESSIIAYRTRIQVIDNFRVMDMAADGQGAPLVPMSEKILFSQKDKRIGLLNIGGIANLTILNDDVKAFDTGPGNMMIDEAMRKLFGQEFDLGGSMALQGNRITQLFDELTQHPYLQLPFPKTTGREVFGEHYVVELLKKYAKSSNLDVIRTFTEFTVYCIVDAIQKQSLEIDQLIVSGGGAYNQCLLDQLKLSLPCPVNTQEDLGLRSDAKEAIAFVVLGNQFLHHRPGNVPSATGAKEALILGKLTPIPYV